MHLDNKKTLQLEYITESFFRKIPARISFGFIDEFTCWSRVLHKKEKL